MKELRIQYPTMKEELLEKQINPRIRTLLEKQ